MPNTNKKKYIIYTNPIEVTLLNLISETSKLYGEFYSINDYYALLEVTKILKNRINNLEEVNNQLSNVLDSTSLENDSDIANETILWDPERIAQLKENDSEFNKFINNIKNIIVLPYSDDEELASIKNYDRYDRNQIINIETNINNTIIKINTPANGTNQKIESNLSKISEIAENNESLANKYTEEIANIQNPENKKFNVNEADINSLMNKILSVVNCEIVEESDNQTKPEPSKYIINVGYKDLPENRINRYVNEINELYNQIYDEDIYQSQLIYVNILSDLINNYQYDSENIIDKPTQLDELKNNNETYLSASDEVKDKVDELLEQYTQSYDNEYVYTDNDKNTIASLVSKSNSKLAQVRNSNNQIMNKIQVLTDKIELAQEEYAQENNGMNYDAPEIDTTPKKESNYDFINGASDIYSKEIPEIQTIVANTDNISIEEDGQTLSIDLSYLPENHKSINSMNVESSNEDVVIIHGSTENSVIIKSVNPGVATITITINGNVTLEIPVEITAKPITYYVYFGMENPINNRTINTSLEGIEEHHNINEIIGQRNIPQISYILLPLEWFRYTQIQNNSHMDMDRGDFNTKVTYNEIEYVVADLTYDNPWSASTIYINELSEPIDPIITNDESNTDEPEEPIINPTRYYFTSWAEDGITQYGYGYVETTGQSTDDKIEVKVVENSVDGFVNNTYWINANATTDNDTLYDLYDNEGNTIGIKVKVYTNEP